MAQTRLETAIEHYKVDSGRTNDEIANDLGITRATLWSKLRGDAPINIWQAKQLSDMLGMTLEEFYEIAPADNCTA